MSWSHPSRWLGRRVLVTGASGFVGRAVCALLAEAGADLFGTWNSTPLPPSVPGEPLDLPGGATELIHRVRPQVVLHLAAPVTVRRDPALYARMRAVILDGTEEVARACLEVGARLVSVGTCEEYGDGEAPFVETQAARPVSPYSALKLAATGYVTMLCRTTPLDAVVVRPFRAYGPGDTRSVVAAACEHALQHQVFEMTDGAQVREWNHVDAIAHGLLGAALHPDVRGRVLNLGGGERRSVRDLVTTVYQLAGADTGLVRAGALPRRAGEIDRFWGDHTATEALLGRLPQPSLDEGLTDTLAWHRARLAL